MAIHLDAGIVDGFFWYTDSFFLKWKLIGLLGRLQKAKFDTIIYPNYSRKYPVDWLVHQVSATTKIGVDGDCTNETAMLKKKSDAFYSALIAVDHSPLHEFERNRQIIESISGEKYECSGPYLEKDKLDIKPNNSIVMFPGASVSAKKWAPSNYNKLCRKINAKLPNRMILVAGKDDDAETFPITEGIPGDRITIETGLNMISLCRLIGGADVLISGDTVAVHIAASLGVRAICIYNGDHFGRFVPYPTAIYDKVNCVLPPGFVPPAEAKYRVSAFNVNDVLPDHVFDALTKTLAVTSPHSI